MSKRLRATVLVLGIGTRLGHPVGLSNKRNQSNESHLPFLEQKTIFQSSVTSKDISDAALDFAILITL